ncbi:V-type ATP synthase subunit D [Erysipelothrix sp. HDW6A]|uniref:V-type ATP synthase subunit D n=1 Tax=Erysipelothrix sp. HDW6A TaxID=2714928 RepID=UPI00140D9925|nr:V-type ATP synthase subunit D [Erysipelothrix sp. HDW6A]QIK57244.1 V-type ATP synthase subunit D [Erysipelothrix sp. HDW6A]
MARLNVNPTRMVLNDLQKRLGIASQGHKLLKEKQDSLIRQFMVYFEQAQVLRKQIDTDFALMNRNYQYASLEMDESILDESLQQTQTKMHVERKQENVFGMSVPHYTIREEQIEESSESLYWSHYRIDDIKKTHPEMKQHLIELAQLEKTCFILAKEIKSTRRRVNALEYKTIPQLEETITYIKLRIDDQVRSQQARVMKVTERSE